MTAPTLHVLQALQAAGKSTLAARIAARTGAAVIDLDPLRRRLMRHCPPAWDPHAGPGRVVQAAWEAAVADALAAGCDVVADRTGLDPRDMAAAVRLAAATGARIVVHRLDVPPAECVRRDALRPPSVRVGELAIRDLHARFGGR